MVRSTLHLSRAPLDIQGIVKRNVRGWETPAEESKLTVAIMAAVDELLAAKEIYSGMSPEGVTVYSKQAITPESFVEPKQPAKEGKPVAKQKTLKDRDGEIADTIPEEVQTAADDYTKLMRAANKAKERANGAKEACLDAMDRCKVKRVRIDDGAKWLVRDEKRTLKTEKIKPNPDDSGR